MRTLPLAVLALVLGACQSDAPEPAETLDPISDETDTSRTLGLATVDAMQGTWRSLDDPALVLRVDGDRATDLYEGEPPKESAIRAVRSCDDPTPAPTSAFFVMDDGQTEPLCFELNVADGETLAFFYQGRGNLLRYERVRE